ncbi:MAG TPA: methyltransferase domain-containing protein [Bacillota bacterium]|nr:methyltransferase domain-containing protein [Bacillota bacterium]
MELNEKLHKIALNMVPVQNLAEQLRQVTMSQDFVEGTFNELPVKPFKNALYIGLGRGMDAVLALGAGYVEKITGVDPYIEEDGSGTTEYSHLIKAIDEGDLHDRLKVEVTKIQDFLKETTETYDLIVANDVLHHMFVTTMPLENSSLFAPATSLFTDLAKVCRPGAFLIISEVNRNGLLPLLKKLKLSSSPVNFPTKQNWQQWHKAITHHNNWHPFRQKHLLPYSLRNLNFLLQGPLPGSLSNRYQLFYSLP